MANDATVTNALEIVDPTAIRGWTESPSAEEWVQDATFLSAAAFTLLRLVGRIDGTGRIRALEAMEILIDFLGKNPGQSSRK